MGAIQVGKAGLLESVRLALMVVFVPVAVVAFLVMVLCLCIITISVTICMEWKDFCQNVDRLIGKDRW